MNFLKKNDRSKKSTIKGIIKDKNGNPLQNNSVMISGTSPPHRDIAALTNSFGEFAFHDLSPGKYTIVTSTVNGILKSHIITINSGQTVSIIIVS